MSITAVTAVTARLGVASFALHQPQQRRDRAALHRRELRLQVVLHGGADDLGGGGAQRRVRRRQVHHHGNQAPDRVQVPTVVHGADAVVQLVHELEPRVDVLLGGEDRVGVRPDGRRDRLHSFDLIHHPVLHRLQEPRAVRLGDDPRRRRAVAVPHVRGVAVIRLRQRPLQQRVPVTVVPVRHGVARAKPAGGEETCRRCVSAAGRVRRARPDAGTGAGGGCLRSRRRARRRDARASACRVSARDGVRPRRGFRNLLPRAQETATPPLPCTRGEFGPDGVTGADVDACAPTGCASITVQARGSRTSTQHVLRRLPHRRRRRRRARAPPRLRQGARFVRAREPRALGFVFPRDASAGLARAARGGG